MCESPPANAGKQVSPAAGRFLPERAAGASGPHLGPAPPSRTAYLESLQPEARSQRQGLGAQAASGGQGGPHRSQLLAVCSMLKNLNQV